MAGSHLNYDDANADLPVAGGSIRATLQGLGPGTGNGGCAATGRGFGHSAR